MFRIAPAEDGLILGKHSVVLDETGIRVISKRHESLYRWAAVRDVTVTNQRLFVMVDSIAGIIVPLKAFPSENDREQFVGEIRMKSGRMTT